MQCILLHLCMSTQHPAMPELTLVSQLLRQASVVATDTSAFDQQWTPHYLKTAFQWTDHLQHQLDTLAEPANVIHSCLQSLTSENSTDPKLSVSVHIPSVQELMRPSVSLLERLFANPTLSDQVRVMLLELSIQQSGTGAIDGPIMAIVYRNKIDQLIYGLQEHFAEMPGYEGADHQVPGNEIEYRAKASLVFDRILTQDPPMDAANLERTLKLYVDEAPSEAMGVKDQLRVMVTKAYEQQKQGSPEVDWGSFVNALTRLEREISGRS